jgi:DNA-binding CsgD family transcriptional regulator
VSAAGGEPFDDDVCLGDQLIYVAVPVGERLVEHGGSFPHALRPLWCARKRRIVVDEMRIQVAVHGVEIACAEQFLDEVVDELLVASEAIGSHGQIVRLVGPGDYPRKLGFPGPSGDGTLFVMPRRARARQAEHDIIRHCHRGVDALTVQHQVLRLLRVLMPIDAAFFATADPETLLFTGARTEEPLDAVTSLFLDNEFGCDDVNKFTSLAASAEHVASLDGATGRDRRSSVRYRDIMRPLGLGDELRAALVVGSQCWGYLCLHRAEHRLGFTPSEAALLARLGPHIAHALRQAVLLGGAPVTPDDHGPGVVLLADDLSVVAITPEAEHLLSLIHNSGTVELPLPVAVHTVAARLRALERGTAPSTALPSTRVRTAAGHWLTVHASRLQGPPGDARIAVIVEPTATRATVPLMLAAHGLTTREAEVARLVLRGTSTRAIADALHISGHTVQDHLKSVFDKVGVRSRRDLVGRLLGPAGCDRG